MVDWFAAFPTGKFLLVVLVIRSVLTLSASDAGVTGGLFLPLLALGVIPAAMIAKIGIALGMDTPYVHLLLALGITACIAGVMKTPLTAILFSLEALSLTANVPAVLTAATVSYVIAEIFNAKSISDSVVESRIEALHHEKGRRVLEAYVTVQDGSFAAGKQIRDILWPNDLFVLSVQATDEADPQVDVHGGQVLVQGDRLHIRYVTYHPADTAEQIVDVVGEQVFTTVDATEI